MRLNYRVCSLLVDVLVDELDYDQGGGGGGGCFFKQKTAYEI